MELIYSMISSFHQFKVLSLSELTSGTLAGYERSSKFACAAINFHTYLSEFLSIPCGYYVCWESDDVLFIRLPIIKGIVALYMSIFL